MDADIAADGVQSSAEDSEEVTDAPDENGSALDEDRDESDGGN